MTYDTNDDFVAALRRSPRPRLSDEARERHLRALSMLTNAHTVQPATEARRRYRIRRAWVPVVVAVSALGAGVGTAAALGAFTTPTDRSIAHCFATASLNLSGNHIDFTVAAPDTGNPSIEDAATAAMAICADAWRQGRLSSTVPYVSWPAPGAAPQSNPVPPLIACVLPSGRAAVFPGDETTCSRLGLRAALL